MYQQRLGKIGIMMGYISNCGKSPHQWCFMGISSNGIRYQYQPVRIMLHMGCNSINTNQYPIKMVVFHGFSWEYKMGYQPFHVLKRFLHVVTHWYHQTWPVHGLHQKQDIKYDQMPNAPNCYVNHPTLTNIPIWRWHLIYLMYLIYLYISYLFIRRYSKIS